MDALLSVNNVTKRFRNQRGIYDISFNVHAGEIVGLFGQNGAGKTTLLKTITGLCRPDTGTVRLFGLDPETRFEQAMAQVGCVIETADAYEYMTGYQNLRQAARLYPEVTAARLDEVLELVGLAPFKHERAKQYSLGMKQRLALAAALLHHPRMVILDEPTNGLDIGGMAEFRNTMERLSRQEGIAFLVSSHMISHLEPIATHIGILHHGELLRFGSRFQLIPPGMVLEEYYLHTIGAGKEAESREQFAGELA
ncbi:ABC transporter ATP-binding protein [Paenibacillus sp. TH7-28]